MPSLTNASPPKAPIYKPDWTLTSNEVHIGSILWLGSVEETKDSQRRRGSPPRPIKNLKTGKEANEGMYEHPVLVVSRPASDPFKILFLPMTSLGHKTLQQRYKGRKATFHRSTFVPVAPAPQHPHYLNGDKRYRRLELEGGAALEKATYVNVREVYEMDWRDAQLYWGGERRLDSASIRRVCALAGTYTGVKVGEQIFDDEQSRRRDSAVADTDAFDFTPRTPSLWMDPFAANMTRPISSRTWELYDQTFPQSSRATTPRSHFTASKTAQYQEVYLPLQGAYLCGGWLC